MPAVNTIPTRARQPSMAPSTEQLADEQSAGHASDWVTLAQMEAVMAGAAAPPTNADFYRILRQAAPDRGAIAAVEGLAGCSPVNTCDGVLSTTIGLSTTYLVRDGYGGFRYESVNLEPPHNPQPYHPSARSEPPPPPPPPLRAMDPWASRDVAYKLRIESVDSIYRELHGLGIRPNVTSPLSTSQKIVEALWIYIDSSRRDGLPLTPNEIIEIVKRQFKSTTSKYITKEMNLIPAAVLNVTEAMLEHSSLQSIPTL